MYASSMSDILITGATGNVGAAIVNELHRNGIAMRAGVRDPDIRFLALHSRLYAARMNHLAFHVGEARPRARCGFA
jgi:NADP-dependent 3-hydroxy acid dehydrogenase YdfG